MEEGDGWAVLSDLGAATFYKGGEEEEGRAIGASAGDEEGESVCALFERLEVLAFGHLMAELLQRLLPAAATTTSAAVASSPSSSEGSGGEAAVVAHLAALAVDCRQPQVAQRPSFAEVQRRLLAIERIE